MRVICIKEIHQCFTRGSYPRSTNLRIKLGEWIDVTTKSRHDYSEDSKLKTRYLFVVREQTEYALDRKDFLTIEEWRDQQIDKLI